MINTRSLFDTTDIWRDDPLEAFKAFALSPEFVKLGRRQPEYKSGATHPVPLRASSARIYVLMFAKFCRWMTRNGKTVFSLSAENIMRFHGAGSMTRTGFKRELNSGISVRYLRMLERVFQHLQIVPNPAQAAMLMR
jgi:integrase/recombinase XerD